MTLLSLEAETKQDNRQKSSPCCLLFPEETRLRKQKQRSFEQVSQVTPCFLFSTLTLNKQFPRNLTQFESGDAMKSAPEHTWRFNRSKSRVTLLRGSLESPRPGLCETHPITNSGSTVLCNDNKTLPSALPSLS